jgi:hypothetical protein
MKKFAYFVIILISFKVERRDIFLQMGVEIDGG